MKIEAVVVENSYPWWKGLKIEELEADWGRNQTIFELLLPKSAKKIGYVHLGHVQQVKIAIKIDLIDQTVHRNHNLQSVCQFVSSPVCCYCYCNWKEKILCTNLK